MLSEVATSVDHSIVTWEGISGERLVGEMMLSRSRVCAGSSKVVREVLQLDLRMPFVNVPSIL